MKNIVLTGYMGIGKTSIGRLLSQKLNMKFCDTDTIIEEKSKMEIKYIFAKYGEKYFRDLESEVVKEVSEYKNYVISTGGGVVLKKENMNRLRKNSLIVYLYGDVDYIHNNLVKTSGKRPLLNESIHLKEKISNMLKEREEYYDDNDFKVDVSYISIEEGANKIIKLLGKGCL
jgi:shikimate kinase